MVRSQSYTKLTPLLSIGILLALAQVSVQQILADEINPGLYSSNSNPYGIPFANWTAKWWQWFIGIPNSQQPFADATGEKCGTNQGGPVWYLVGAAGKVERTCTIPSDKAILFPILDTECSYSESPSLKTQEDLRKCALDANKDAIIKASVDNQEIKVVDKYRVTSNIFNVTYPNDPVFPTNSNFSQAVSDGWFIFLEPLKPGEHVIKFSASQLAGPTTAENTAVDVTYHLNIKENATSLDNPILDKKSG